MFKVLTIFWAFKFSFIEENWGGTEDSRLHGNIHLAPKSLKKFRIRCQSKRLSKGEEIKGNAFKPQDNPDVLQLFYKIWFKKLY